MAWGVLDDPKYPNIPGTVRLEDEADESELIRSLTAPKGF